MERGWFCEGDFGGREIQMWLGGVSEGGLYKAGGVRRRPDLGSHRVSKNVENRAYVYLWLPPSLLRIHISCARASRIINFQVAAT